MNNASLPDPRACLICGTSIEAHAHPAKKYCSSRCRIRAQHLRLHPNAAASVDCCVICGTALPAGHHAQKRYCSNTCKVKACYYRKHPAVKRHTKQRKNMSAQSDRRRRRFERWYTTHHTEKHV